MNTQKDRISILIKILLAGSFFYIWCILMFYSSDLAPQFLLPNFCIFIGVFTAAILSAMLFGRYQAGKAKQMKRIWNENICLLLASIALFSLQLFISWNIVFRTSWDPGAVWYGAHYVAMNDMDGINTMSEYFSIYPNNLLLVYIYSRILKLNLAVGEPVSNGILLLVMFQCVLLTITGILVFKYAKHYVSVKASWAAYFLYVILAGLSAWMVIPYSDATGIIFPILLLGIYLKIKESNIVWNKYCLVVLLVCFGYIGFCIKPMSAIVLIAAVVIELINWVKGKVKGKSCGWNLRQILCLTVVIIAAFALISQITAALIAQMHFNIDSERQLGWQHFLMMGANIKTNGGFSEEDLAFSSEFSNQKLKKAEELRVFKERMQEMGGGLAI